MLQFWQDRAGVAGQGGVAGAATEVVAGVKDQDWYLGFRAETQPKEESPCPGCAGRWGDEESGRMEGSDDGT